MYSSTLKTISNKIIFFQHKKIIKCKKIFIQKNDYTLKIKEDIKIIIYLKNN